MKHRRSSIIVILLFFLAFSIPLLTQTQVFSDVSVFVTFISTLFDKEARETAPPPPRRNHPFMEIGKLSNPWIWGGIVISGIAGTSFLIFLWHNRNRLKWRRQFQAELKKRKEVEADLQNCIEIADRANRNSPVTSYRFRFTDHWQIDFISDAVTDLTGNPPSHFIGGPVSAFADLIHPEDRERVSGYFETAFQDKRPIVLIYRILDKNRRVKWVCEKAVGYGNPVPDPVSDLVSGRVSDSGPCGIEGFIIDVTRQKQLEADNMLGWGMLNSLMDALPDLIYFKDRKGEYLACNPSFANFSGKEPREIVGKTDYDLFPKDAADKFRENDLKMLSRMKQRKNHERISFPDGRKTVYETFRTPLAAMDGKIIGLVGVSRDITSVIAAKQRNIAPPPDDP